MSSFTGLTLNRKYISKEWICNHFRNLDPKTLSDNELRTLVFCGHWLTGAREFTIQTSGSTGAPKTIRLYREQMTASARLTGDALNLKKGDHALACLSPAYIGGLMMLVRAMVLDLELTAVEPSGNPFESLCVSDESSVESFDFAAFVPLQLQNMISGNKDAIAFLNKMKAILVGGAPVPVSLRKKLQAIQASIYETFGMTETLSHIALRRVNGPGASDHYQALPGVTLGLDRRGCLTIQAPSTKRQFVMTNDLVELKSDGSFVWLGRIDNVINTGGVKVQPESVERIIEETLAAIPDIGVNLLEKCGFFVGSIPDEILGEKVTIVFEGLQFPQEIIDPLFKNLTRNLNKYEVPKAVACVESFVRTRSGKIDRKATLDKLVGPKV
ncbi:AMP-binding protein [candidate division KSB1 bacterium]|nr:AMP-binding protein [candidate division KSB1 bacterium]NIR69452.1 AMP-binding protein [candidate division KSB1 bacterium]NIS22801.1 AMP-binding protein [candidate division KSB1 bacterium]NIT69641.1 AMP-binding protein [candidate division KSB1 bacterium]NIU23310.1 AMP-binding protein [candidate division KSB1 bacterium]